MAKKKDQTLLYIGAGLAAVYLLTRQRQQQQQIPVQPAPGRGGGATWVDVALEYGDDLFNVLFGKRNKGGSSGNLTGDVTFLPNSGGFPIPIQIQGIEQQSEGEITDVQWN